MNKAGEKKKFACFLLIDIILSGSMFRKVYFSLTMWGVIIDNFGRADERD